MPIPVHRRGPWTGTRPWCACSASCTRPRAGCPHFVSEVMMASQHMPYRAGDGAPHARTAPEIAVRLVGALLALAVSAVHAAEQGGVTALASPDWIGWGYRLIEAGGVLTVMALLVAPMAPPPTRSARPVRSVLARRLGWAAGMLLGTGPFLAYIASRTVGMPGDPRDVGNWDHWLGTVSLLVEGALVALSVSMLLTLRPCGRVSEDRGGRRMGPGCAPHIAGMCASGWHQAVAAEHAALAQRIGARLVTMSRSVHASMLEETGAFNALLRDTWHAASTP